VGNYAQGMMGCVPLFLKGMAKGVTVAKIHKSLSQYFAKARFVEVAPLESLERAARLDPQDLNNTNKLRLHVLANEVRGQVLIMSIYDNLGKGASGAAVQNLNLMIGADEACAVDLIV
ncbi:MAG: N-acetyl-gamma-glutamyl-phosphate reductase, partial [Alphaproteobacteria bacterium]|nr:N-acetyl-gamma-glutamyl-phosphate reductase [Alphaproteobacteria bacterium]